MPNETRATRYHRARLQAGAGAFFASLLVLVGCGPWLAGPRLAAAVTVGSGVMASAVATALFAGLVLGLVQLARYPLERHRDWTLESRYGLARVPSGSWTRAHVRGSAATVTLGIAAALFVRATWQWAGSGWWLVSAAGLLVAHVAWTVAAPLLLVVFGGLRPLRRPGLADRASMRWRAAPERES